MAKKKVLLLGTHDSKMAGHIQSTYNQIKDFTEAVMVTRYSLYKKNTFCFWASRARGMNLIDIIVNFKYSSIFLMFWKYIHSLFILNTVFSTDRRHQEYCFYDYEYLPYTADAILKKCPKGFVPDIVYIGWCSNFISAKIIHDLYQETKAKVVYVFTDEAPMTGGCHYPVDCKEYLSGCNNCPALRHGKKIAAMQMRDKEKWLKDIPLYLVGSPCDMRLAKQSPLFKEAVVFPSVGCPQVNITPQRDARERFGLPNDKFVVLIGATSIDDIRKGFIYASEAINMVSSTIPNMLIMILGRTPSSLKPQFPGVEIRELGFVDVSTMIMAYCAADCFLSTTIADSGPQMVNYSIATGTPVISFPIGIAEDLVIHKKTGYIAQYKDSKDIADGILFISRLNEMQKHVMSECCIRTIKELSSKGGWKRYLLNINN